ncbi:MAG TPA: lysylphosphatidylglycerol synthase transmembrane domain-containing protein [Burkholderiales bacterium]|nr:lysylphosphatidylglycerol synthase transmembrane domain-containing protein [Burkholderiales bacterium]
MRSSGKLWLRMLQTVLSFSLLFYLIRFIDWETVHGLFESGVVFSLWPGPVVLLVGVVLAATRWYSILEFLGITIRRSDALRFYLAGNFYGVMLPGVLGGDLVRVALTRLETDRGTAAVAASVAIERSFGLWSIALIGTLGAITLSPPLKEELGRAVLFLSPIIAVGVPLAAYASLHGAGWVGGLRSERGYVARLVLFVQKIAAIARSFPPRLASMTLLLSIAFQGAEIFIFYYFGSVLGIQVPFTFYLFVVPIVYLSTLVPISLGGVGVREGVLVWFFAMIGIAAGDAVLLAFLIYLNRVVVAVIGGCTHFFKALIHRNATLPQEDISK